VYNKTASKHEEQSG